MRLAMSKVDVRYGVGVDALSEEQMSNFKEGLFKSKGASNNMFSAMLAVAGASADEIAKYGGNVEDRTFLKKEKELFTPSFRAVMQVIREVPNFWDTVKGRKLKEKNVELLKKVGLNPDEYLPVTRFSAELSNMYLQRSYRVTGSSYCLFQQQRDLAYNSVVGGKIVTLEVFEPLADVKFGAEDSIEKMAGETVKQEKVSLPDYHKNREYEVDSLAHMDESITSAMRPRELMVDMLKEDYDGCFRNNPDSSYSIQIMCIMEGFYEVCREMGIVGVLDNAVDGRYWVSQSAMKGIMQNVIKMAGTYRRLVKSGFAESVARETVIAEINEGIAKRASRPQLRFYPRNDYKDTPEEERVKVKATSGNGTSRNRVLTLDEFMKATGLKEEE